MKLRFLGKESTPTNSPTLYATDQESYVVQGWIITDTTILTQLVVPQDQGVVEVPPTLLAYLAVDGVQGSVTNLVPPIVGVTGTGHYIIQGTRVTDSEMLGQMSIPEHESCVQVTRSAMLALIGE